MKNLENLSVSNKFPQLVMHDAVHLFPPMSDEAFNELKEDIRLHGQQVPIVVQNGLVLDGRHRYRACCELGIVPRIEEVPNTVPSIERLVVSLNQHRRHLSESQRAMIAARLSNTKLGTNQHTAQAVSQSQAAADLNVSVASVQRAKAVLKNGASELIKAVEAGKVDVSNAAIIATFEESDQRAVLAVSEDEILKKAKAIRKRKMDARRAKVLEQIEAKRANNKPLNPHAGPYNVIYADPPWDYMGEVAVGYPTMTLQEICAMPVNDIATEDAVLFLWCSASLMHEALAVIEAWGFTYKTQAIWNKQSPGQGTYFRIQHEVLMIATRGRIPEVPVGSRPASVFSLPRREHSRKPDYGYELIEAMYPELKKIELFCRGVPRNGWAGWGNECITDEVVQDGVEVVLDTDVMPEAANDAQSPRRRGRPRKQEHA